MLRFLVNSLEVTSVLKDSQHNFFLRIKHMVARLVVMPHTTPSLRGVPDVVDLREGLGMLRIDRTQKICINGLAPLHPLVGDTDGTNEQLLMAGHDVRKV